MNTLFRIGVAWLALIASAVLLHALEPAPEKEPPVTRALTEAVQAGRCVTFIYKGHERTVEPHALGTANDGKPALLGWQTSGGSSTEPPRGWRVFLIADITSLKPSETTFSKRADYHQGKSRGLKSITVEIPTAAETTAAPSP